MDNKSLVKKILQKENLKYRDVKRLSGGQVNFVFLVDNNYVVRVGGRSDSQKRLLSEAKLIERFQKRIPLPEILACGGIEDWVYQVQSFIKGEPLYKLWGKLTNRRKEVVVKNLVQFLKILHRTDFKEYGFYHSDKKYSQWLTFWIARAEEIKEELSSVKTYIPQDIVKTVFRYFASNKSVLANGKPCLVHGDLWLGNVLIEGSEIVGILDFESAIQAPVEYELLSIEKFCLYPNDYKAEDEKLRFSSSDFGDFGILFKKYYPEIFKADKLRQRLDIYHILTTVSSHLGYLQRIKKSWGKHFPINPVAKITNFLFEDGIRLF